MLALPTVGDGDGLVRGNPSKTLHPHSARDSDLFNGILLTSIFMVQVKVPYYRPGTRPSHSLSGSSDTNLGCPKVNQADANDLPQAATYRTQNSLAG